jgi:hypothetical protein
MDRARPYSFRIIFISAGIFVAGFFAGAKGGELFLFPRQDKQQLVSADSIMVKRMQAIRASKKSGKCAYEFKVKAPYPVLGNQ